MLFFIRWLDAGDIRRDPNLQKMCCAILGVVEFAVSNPGSCAHALHVTWLDRRAITHAVLMRQRAIEHIADDLHVAMGVLAKAHAGGDAIFIDHPQGPERHVFGFVVVGE